MRSFGGITKMSKFRVLIIEDEEAIAEMIALNLNVVGFETTIYDDGKIAKEKLALNHEYDIALLDIMIPGKDGYELLEIMKGYGIPSIFITAKDDVESKIKGLRNGAEDYIVKPFEILELIVKIEKVLERYEKLKKQSKS